MENRKIQYLSICNTCQNKPGADQNRKGLWDGGWLLPELQVVSCLLTCPSVRLLPVSDAFEKFARTTLLLGPCGFSRCISGRAII